MSPPGTDAATRSSPYLSSLQSSIPDRHQNHHLHSHYQHYSAPSAAPPSRSWPPQISTSSAPTAGLPAHMANPSVSGHSAPSSAAPSSVDCPDDPMDLSPSSTPRPTGTAQSGYPSVPDPQSPSRRPNSAEGYRPRSHLDRLHRQNSVDEKPTIGDVPSYSHRQPLAALANNAPSARPSPPTVSVQVHDDAGSDSEKSTHTVGPQSASSLAVPPAQANGALGSAAQSKVQSAAFIHKLYSMLEDPKISHLIYWSDTNDSFIMSPSSDFSKVLSSYFKHTNISSFVRQLNMYGFHKVVTDAFQTASPDTPIWEFRHGNGSFNRGDLEGLREIKRRASRHHMISRESFSGPSSKLSLPGPPMVPAINPIPHPPPDHIHHHLHPAPILPDPFETRLTGHEHHVERRLYEHHIRCEEAFALMNSRWHALNKGLHSATVWTQQLCNIVLRLIPDSNHPVRQDLVNMQRDVSGQLEALQRLAEESIPPGFRHSPFQPPVPAQLHRRTEGPSPGYPSETLPQPQAGPYPGHRPSVTRFPGPLPTPPAQRFGSTNGPSGPGYPSNPRHSATLMPPPPPPQSVFPPPNPVPHSSASSPRSLRRHTSADIRQHGWNYSAPHHPSTGHTAPQWPPSPTSVPPSATSAHSESQNIRETLASFNFGQPSRVPPMSRRASPPPPLGRDISATGRPVSPSMDALHQSSQNSRFPFTSTSRHFGHSLELPPPATAPGSRRTSMASNVHALLNPDRRPSDDAHDSPGQKRKRR